MAQKFNSIVSNAVIGWLTPDRVKLYPPLIPIFLLIAWGISQYLGPGLTDSAGTIIGSDFLAFYNAGYFYQTNQMDKLYDFYAQYVFQNQLAHPVALKAFHPFINPPFTAGFFSLFSNYDYLYALLMWWAAGLLLLLGSIMIIRSEFAGLLKYSLPHLLKNSFLFFPTLAWFIFGQNSPYTLFLYTVFFVMLRRGKDFLSGLALGLLLYKPQLIILLGIVLVVKRRWRALLGGLLSAGFLILSGLIASPQALYGYLKISPYLVNILRLNPDSHALKMLGLKIGIVYPTWGIHSFFGFFSLLLDNLSRTATDLICLLFSLLCIFYSIKIWLQIPWEPRARQWDFMMAATFAMGLLVSPHLFTYDLMLLLLPVGIIWTYYLNGTDGKLLDGGQLLFWTFMLYVFCFIGAYLSKLQLVMTSLLGFPAFAVQFSFLVILGWSFCIIKNSNDKRSTLFLQKPE